MAKNQATSSAHRNGAVRDRSKVNGNFVKRDADTARAAGPKGAKAPRRKILFPTEPTTIPREEIDRAIDLVMSRRK
jgi:hypothetical protein